MYGIFDQVLSEALGVTVEEYIKIIESISEFRREAIIMALLSDDDNKIKKARSLFNIIKERANDKVRKRD